PPEQMGRLPHVTVGPYSDVYGFGKTCCYALFRTTQPLPRHWQGLPPALADLLGRCLEETPDRRPAGFGLVLRQFDRLACEALPVVAVTAAEIDPPSVLPVEEPQHADLLRLEAVEEVERADRPGSSVKRSSSRRRAGGSGQAVTVRIVYLGRWFPV